MNCGENSRLLNEDTSLGEIVALFNTVYLRPSKWMADCEWVELLSSDPSARVGIRERYEISRSDSPSARAAHNIRDSDGDTRSSLTS